MVTEMKKIMFITQIILLAIMTLGIAVSMLFGDDYDMICLIPAIISFLLFWCYGFVKQFEDKKFLDFDLSEIKLVYKLIILFISLIFIGFSIFGFFLSTIYGGNAEIINGEYQIISHNNFVRYISKEEYNVLHFFERFSWIFVVYVLALLHILCLKYKD